MIHLRELKQRHAKLVDDAGAILAGARALNRVLTADEEKRFNGLHDEAETVHRTIQSEERHAERERSLAEGQFGREQRGETKDRDALGAVLSPEQRCTDWVRSRGQLEDTRDEIRTGHVLRAWLAGPSSVRDLREAEQRALSEGTDSAGGYTVPLVVSAQLIDLMRARMVTMRAGARTIPLDSDKQRVAVVASGPATAWAAENATLTGGDPTFAERLFDCETLTCGPIRVSRQLIEDSMNLDRELPRVIANAMAVELDRAALFGAGASSEPLGLVAITGVNEHSMGTNGAAITNYDPLLSAIKLAEDDNANDPTAAIMAPRTSDTLAKFKDTTNQPLARPPKIANLPFLVTTSVPVDEDHGTATTASRIVIGDFPEMMIGVRTSLRLLRLVERYADNLQVGFIAYLRADVQVAHPESFTMVTGIIP